MNFINKIKFFFRNRFVIFLLFCIIFVVVQFVFSKKLLPSTETKDIWFYSGIFMVLFSILFIEPYYSSPKNVITNAVPLLLVFLSIKSSFTNTIFWWAFVAILIGLLISSIIALTLENKDLNPEHWRNNISAKLKNIVVVIGQGKVLYSAVFLYFLLTYYSIQSLNTLILFVIWFFIISLNPKDIHGSFPVHTKKSKEDQIGEIFSVQASRVFLVRLFDDKCSIKKFEMVKFKYSMQKNVDKVNVGIILDTYSLNQEKWVQVIQLGGTKEENLEKNMVYKMEKDKELFDRLNLGNLAGMVIDGSSVGKIKFEYSKKEDNLQEGDLLELKIGKRRLFYQVIGGYTEKERLERRNERGFIEGEAIQLGEWQGANLSFQKFGWVPSINTPVFKTNASDITVGSFAYPDYELGKIPNTQLPSVINLNEAISHHMALLGVTGSGKSYLAREIINKIKSDTKVICVDFNKEFASSLTPAPTNIISNEKAKEIAGKIDWINNELEKFGNNQDKTKIESSKVAIKEILKSEIKIFLADTVNNIKVFELPDVSNTTGIFDYTKYFFRELFEVAKEKQIAGDPVKICVVLEEAHTIIPEWNFSGSSDKASQGLVNSIGQITLQGRKYGVGFLVIAQRTANVSKTVLTQCNTVICFQAFDETSYSFLSNYVGQDTVRALPNLKQYHAVVAGKAVKSNMPMIIDLTR
jgi:hypothetical protein